MYSARHTNWKFVDDEGGTWREFPHTKDSHSLVSFGPADEQNLNYALGYDPDDIQLELTHDGLVTTEGDWPIGPLMAVLQRAHEWLTANGMPPGTRLMPQRDKKGKKSDERQDDSDKA